MSQEIITIKCKVNTGYEGLFFQHIRSSFEAFTAVMFRAEVFWNVMPCGVVAGYQCISGVTTQKTSA
jgi:hypothetical protein